MEFNYNTRKDPPRPECPLTVSNPSDSTKSTPIDNAIADTGADITWIPESKIQQLGSLKYTEIKSKFADGSISIRRKYLVTIQIANDLYERCEVLASPTNTTLIGRDILNNYKLSFDGRQDKCKWKLGCNEDCTRMSSQ